MPDRRFNTQKEEAAYRLGLADAAKSGHDEPLTMDAIRKMSVREVAERLPEVNAVLAGGNDDDQ